MYLKKLSLINFKNIREENLEFRPGINCFVGDNGAGKTNVIDAVYFLSMCKSSLAMTDGQNMRHGSDFFLLDGQYLTDEGRSESVASATARISSSPKDSTSPMRARRRASCARSRARAARCSSATARSTNDSRTTWD